MDANTIRIILIIVGALLILALFLWERSRRADAADEDGDYEEADSPYGLPHTKREPRFGAVVEDEESVGPVRVVRTRSPTSESGDDDESRRRLEIDSGRYAEQQPPANAEPLLIQLSVSARREPFAGPDLISAAESCGLRPGQMDIFHCLDEFDDHTRIYFSMANMVKPGTFPFDDMEEFSTPGLMLFAQLDGRPEDMTILEEMTATARKLASVLNGDVLDETRRPLTVSREESLRQAVLDNERRWSKTAER